MKESLRFGPDGTFTIVQFTDIHWENGEQEDVETRRLMERVLDDVRPDLIAYTGDVVAGYAAQDPIRAFQNAIAPAVSRQIPWAFTFGNHDTERFISRNDMRRAILQMPLSINQAGPDGVHGYSNFATPVMSRDGAIRWVLYFLDSGVNAPIPEIGGYDWIRRDQIAWYVATSEHFRQMNNGRPVPSLAFFHIPLPEYGEAAQVEPLEGLRLEDECSPRLNTGLFAAMVEQGDVKGTFVGHDHLNDYTVDWHGVRLGYGRATGYHGYGRDDFPRGARIIRFREGEETFVTFVQTVS